jgi:hypothetical protein
VLARKFFYVSLGILAIAASYHVGARSVAAQAGPSPRSRNIEELETTRGRYLFESLAGTPNGGYVIDSATGRLWRLSSRSQADAESLSTPKEILIFPGPFLEAVPYGIAGWNLKTGEDKTKYRPDDE